MTELTWTALVAIFMVMVGVRLTTEDTGCGLTVGGLLVLGLIAFGVLR